MVTMTTMVVGCIFGNTSTINQKISTESDTLASPLPVIPVYLYNYPDEDLLVV